MNSQLVKRNNRQFSGDVKESAQNPATAQAYFKLGVVEGESGNADAAVDYYKRAIELDPGMAEAWYNLGLMMYSRKNTMEAVLCYQKAIQIYPEFMEAFYQLGKCYCQMQHADRALRCFQRVLEIKPAFALVHILMGDILQETGRTDCALEHFRAALELEPESAELYNKIGENYKRQGKLRRAQANFQRALELQPDFPDALFNLAYVHGELGQRDNAIHYYQLVLEIAPDSAETHYNLAGLLAADGRNHDAIPLLEKALRIKPDHVDGHNNLGLNLKAVGRIHEAIRQYRKAIEINPEAAHVHLNLSLALLLIGEFSEGWREYDWRFDVDPYQADYRYRGHKIWDGRSFSGKRLLVHDDQGLGDTLQFARYLPLVKKMGGTLILETRREILPLLAAFPAIDELLERPPEGGSNVEFDYYIPLLSVPGRIGTRADSIPADIPYLFADAKKCAYWQENMKRPGIMIGLVWAGNKAHVNDANRSCSLDQFGWLADFPQTVRFSLQKDFAPEEEMQLQKMGVTNLGRLLHDFSETAAVIENLDLVITVDTAVAHLAGAMGKTTWILLPFDPDWRWMRGRSDSPWYPTVRLFRQSRPGDWATVVASVYGELKKIVNT